MVISRRSKRVLLAALCLGALGVVVAAGLGTRLGPGAQTRTAALASDALGMDVAIGGQVTVGIVHGLHLALGDVRVRRCGREVAVAGEVDLGVALLPLLHGELRIETLRLAQLQVVLEADRGGILSPVKGCGERGSIPALAIGTVIVSRSSLRYADADSGTSVEATDCSGEIRGLTLSAGHGESAAQRLSFAASGRCAQLRVHELTAEAVTLSVHGGSGRFVVDPVGMRLLGGEGSGSLQANFAGPVPAYELRYQLVNFQIEEAFKALSLEARGAGLLSFSAALSLRGADAREWWRTLAGEASLQGMDLRLDVGDLDERFSRYEASQNFNLVDIGAALFLGPVGLGITKGLDFARNLQDAAGSTTFTTLRSEWQLEQGVAHARDVAMATRKSRLALKGSLDLVGGRFVDVTVALVDATGCATVEQRVTGPFLAPRVEPPSVLASLTGPTRRVLGRVRTLLGARCEVYYAGAVAAPT